MSKEALPVIPSGAEGLKEIIALTHQARGIDVVTIDLPPEGVGRGLPQSIPIGIRHGTTPEAVSLATLFEAYRFAPAAKRGTAVALTLSSFIDLTNRHRTEHSAIFANTDWQKPSFQAVIDYHEVDERNADTDEIVTHGQPDNLRHRIRYEFPISDEWKAWNEINGKWQAQGDFAEFIRDHVAELVSPFVGEANEIEQKFQTTVATPADLLRLSRGLQVHVASAVKQAVTLETGEGQISWEETHHDGDGKPLKVPGAFILSVAPFFGGEPIRLPVSLRYRTGGGKVAWGIVLYRPDIYVTERVRDDLEKVAGSTNLPTFEGSPEAA